MAHSKKATAEHGKMSNLYHKTIRGDDFNGKHRDSVNVLLLVDRIGANSGNSFLLEIEIQHSS